MIDSDINDGYETQDFDENTTADLRDELAALPVEIEQIIENAPDSRDSHGVLLKGRSGPLPSPTELTEYDKAFPGLAMRIVRMAELTTRSRVKENQSDSVLRKSALEQYWQTVRERNRLWAVVALAAILLDAYLAYLNIYAGSLFGAFEVGVVLLAYFNAHKTEQDGDSSEDD